LKELLEEVGFKGHVECKITAAQAVQYLNILQDSDGHPVSADLVFCTYDIYDSKGMDMLE